MNLRKEFVLKALSRDESMIEVCREYGISRKTGYKWIDRFQREGFQGLVDESRRPITSPLETTADHTLEILRLRKVHPTWGPRKLWALMRRAAKHDDVPSVRTIARVLRRAKVVKPKRRRQTAHVSPFRAPSCPVAGPNDLWTVDFKGWWCVGDGRKCEPLTVRDAFSRFVLMLRIVANTSVNGVVPLFEELFERHGLPKAIQSDNGSPFASVKSPGGLTRLSAWWVSLGIELVHSRPACPQDNGAHERMHGDIRLEIQGDAAGSLEAQQRVCDDWRTEFNHVRPHDALGLRTPAEFYAASPRRPSHIVVGGYPDDCEIRRLDAKGRSFINGHQVTVGSAIAGRQIGLQNRIDGTRVWFYSMLLGTIPPDAEHMIPSDYEACHQTKPESERTARATCISGGVADGHSPLPGDSSQTTCPQERRAASDGSRTG